MHEEILGCMPSDNFPGRIESRGSHRIPAIVRSSGRRVRTSCLDSPFLGSRMAGPLMPWDDGQYVLKVLFPAKSKLETDNLCIGGQSSHQIVRRAESTTLVQPFPTNTQLVHIRMYISGQAIRSIRANDALTINGPSWAFQEGCTVRAGRGGAKPGRIGHANAQKLRLEVSVHLAALQGASIMQMF